MLDSTVVCRRALGCEWGGKYTRYMYNDDPLWLVHTVYVYQRPANGNEGQCTHAYRQGFTARKRARRAQKSISSPEPVSSEPSKWPSSNSSSMVTSCSWPAQGK